jgi:hypothetical protein
MRRDIVATGLACVLAGVAACAKPKPAPPPVPPPALEVPVVPPRVLSPVPVEAAEAAPTDAGASSPTPAQPTRPRPKPEGTSQQRPGESPQGEPSKTETSQSENPTEPAKPAAPEPSVLRTPQTPDNAASARQIGEVLSRTRRDLASVNVAALASDARAQFENARRFVDQADAALKARNYMFARYLADKAEALARGLQGR